MQHGIDYPTFLAAALDWSACVSRPTLESYVTEAFNSLDKDGDGLLSLDDLEQSCMELNELSVTGIQVRAGPHAAGSQRGKRSRIVTLGLARGDRECP